MSNLSENELLDVMSEFPKHELSAEKRMETLKMIRGHRVSRRRKINFQRIAALAAMFILVLLAPILYFSNGELENTQRTGTGITRAENGVYFALNDNEGNPIYVDSNFGIPNKVSLLAPREWIAEDRGSVAKMMVFLWGDYEKEFANKTLKIDAVHIKTGKKMNLTTIGIMGPHNGADAHALTSFSAFETPGVWNLDFMVGEKTIGEFSIYVKEPYVTIGNSTLVISQEDLHAGVYEDINIQVVGEDLPPEIEMELYNLEDGEKTTYNFNNKTDFTREDGKKISTYTGDFYLKKSGKYRITVSNQSEMIEVRKPISD